MVFMGGHNQEATAACLKFAKVHLDVSQRYWQNILWTDETTSELFGRNTQHCVERKKGAAHQHQNLIPTVNHCGGASWFVATLPQRK